MGRKHRNIFPGHSEAVAERPSPHHTQHTVVRPHLIERDPQPLTGVTLCIEIDQEFNTWIRPLVLCSVAQGIATISAPSGRVKQGLEQRYTAPIAALLTTLLDAPIRVQVILDDEVAVTQAQSKAEDATLTGAEAADPTADRKMPPTPAPDYRPDWISANQWVALPAMLRAALIGSTMTDGALQPASPHMARLLATRYAYEVAALGVAMLTECHANESPTVAV